MLDERAIKKKSASSGNKSVVQLIRPAIQCEQVTRVRERGREKAG